MMSSSQSKSRFRNFPVPDPKFVEFLDFAQTLSGQLESGPEAAMGSLMAELDRRIALGETWMVPKPAKLASKRQRAYLRHLLGEEPASDLTSAAARELISEAVRETR